MTEGSRALRYIMPGVLCAAEVLLLCWIVLPVATECVVWEVTSDAGIGLLLFSIITTGAGGFLLGAIHHVLYWKCPWYSHVDLQRLLLSLRGSRRLFLSDASGCKLAKKPLTREEAWSVATVIWHQRVSPQLKGADARLASLVDLMHSLGSMCVAAVAAPLLSLMILCCHVSLDFSCEPIVRFIVAVGVSGLILVVFRCGYRHLVNSTQGVIEGVLHDVLSVVPAHTWLSRNSI